MLILHHNDFEWLENQLHPSVGSFLSLLKTNNYKNFSGYMNKFSEKLLLVYFHWMTLLISHQNILIVLK